MKDKIIEEMARICREHRNPTEICIYPESEDCRTDCELYNPDISCRWIKTAKALYNAGYRKIPENVVVLTKEEYEKLTTPMLLIKQKPLSQKELYKKLNEMAKYGVIGVDDGIIETIPTRKEIEKETAEKFARIVEFHSVSTRDEEGREIFTISALGLKEILHEEFGIPYDEIWKGITENKV